MYPRHLTASEHDSIRVSIDPGHGELSPAEAEALSVLGEARPGFCERRYGSVRLAQYCGVVKVGSRALEILPKIDDAQAAEQGRTILLRMLRTATGLPLFRHLTVSQRLGRAPLLEVFIAAFFDEVAQIVRGGLLRQYLEQEQDLEVVRGRIVARRQFATLANRSDRVACRFDDLTADNVWNRIIKAGLEATRHWITSGELARRWVELMIVLEDVRSDGVSSSSFRSLVFDRHARRYGAAVEWARWILELTSPALRLGEQSAPGLLVDMNALFESAIASALRRRCTADPSLQIETQDRSRHLASVPDTARRSFRLRPDLVARRNGGVVAIADTKWKRLEVRGGRLRPAETDMYQMLAYAAAYECGQLALIYPWHSGLEGAVETAYELPNVAGVTPVVTIICVDVAEGSFNAVRGGGSGVIGDALRE